MENKMEWRVKKIEWEAKEARMMMLLQQKKTKTHDGCEQCRGAESG